MGGFQLGGFRPGTLRYVLADQVTVAPDPTSLLGITIGLAAADAQDRFHLRGNGAGIQLDSDQGGTPALRFNTREGTFASPSDALANDVTGFIQFSGYQGGAGRATAEIRDEIQGFNGAGHPWSKLRFRTTDGSPSLVDAMWITYLAVTMDTNVIVTGTLTAQYDIVHTGSNLGFFGASATAQQSHIADPAANAGACATAIASILDALEAYGLLATS